jgi:CRISPR system Cascade subunit CasE
MFMTRMPLNIRRRGAVHLLGSPQRMHAAVMAAFPDATAGEGGRVLWRVDRSHQGVALFVVSPLAPDLTHVAEEAGWPTTTTWETKQYDHFVSGIAAGDRMAFRLRANPVHSVRTRSDQADTKVTAHVTATQQGQWLLDRGTANGFAIVEGADGADQVLVRDRQTERFRRGGQIVTLSSAVFEGELVVQDAEAFRGVLTAGLGRAKAYGCGLMTVVPMAVG